MRGSKGAKLGLHPHPGFYDRVLGGEVNELRQKAGQPPAYPAFALSKPTLPAEQIEHYGFADLAPQAILKREIPGTLHDAEGTLADQVLAALHEGAAPLQRAFIHCFSTLVLVPMPVLALALVLLCCISWPACI